MKIEKLKELMPVERQKDLYDLFIQTFGVDTRKVKARKSMDEAPVLHLFCFITKSSTVQ